jgi:hypothetical protein
MHHLQANLITTHSIDSLSWEPQQVELYAQIQAFQIDSPFVSLPFSKRLARDHQWSLIYTERVIEEYKKFLFLAIVADHPVTPSNAVDQVWHLHLTYTHSYWNDLCTHILPRPLHHHPTQGGQQQRELFWDCYHKTLDSYEHFFSDRAPVDIWPTPASRFRQAGQFRQINSEDYWVIPKPSFALFQRVFWQISHLSWLRNVMISLLTIGLIFSLNFLDCSAISANVNLTNVATTQPDVAQISSSLNHDASPDSTVKPAQDSGWMWWVIGFFLVSGFIVNWISSWCPVCKRPWLVETTTCVLREPTEQEKGEQLVTRHCECCQYTQEWYEAIFKEPDSDFGCGCGI